MTYLAPLIIILAVVLLIIDRSLAVSMRLKTSPYLRHLGQAVVCVTILSASLGGIIISSSVMAIGSAVSAENRRSQTVLELERIEKPVGLDAEIWGRVMAGAKSYATTQYELVDCQDGVAPLRLIASDLVASRREYVALFGNDLTRALESACLDQHIIAQKHSVLPAHSPFFPIASWLASLAVMPKN